jgi:hypothetical protein
MSTDKKPDTPAPPGDAVAEGNIERLLTVAYKPEAPSDDFARKLRETAQQRAAQRPAPLAAARFTLGAVVAWSALSAAAAAAVVAMVLSAKAVSDKAARPPQLVFAPPPAHKQNDEQAKLARELAAKCVELETKHAELASRFAKLNEALLAAQTAKLPPAPPKESAVTNATQPAETAKPVPAPRPEPVVASIGEDGPKLRPIALQLPKPLFEGTPKALKGVVLAKPRGMNEQFLAPAGCWNVALNKPVTSSDPEPAVGSLKQITDGDKEAVEGSYVELGPGVQWVQIDLQGVYAIHYVLLWHFHKEARVYRDVVVQVADDADFITNVRTVFNNDQDNSSGLGVGQDMEYLDEYLGKLIDAKGVKARFIRCYSKGNSSNDQNHYTEVEVFGVPAK